MLAFILPIELVDRAVRPGLERAIQGARAAGTPFISCFTSAEMVELARAAGFTHAEHVAPATLSARYFAGRSDGLRLSAGSEELAVASNT